MYIKMSFVYFRDWRTSLQSSERNRRSFTVL